MTYSFPRQSHHLFIINWTTNVSFLVYTGSGVSVLPANNHQKLNAPVQMLLVANSLHIDAYGQQTISLEFKLRKFTWTFLLANLSTPILGADFLYYFELVSDLCH